MLSVRIHSQTIHRRSFHPQYSCHQSTHIKRKHIDVIFTHRINVSNFVHTRLQIGLTRLQGNSYDSRNTNLHQPSVKHQDVHAYSLKCISCLGIQWSISLTVIPTHPYLKITLTRRDCFVIELCSQLFKRM